VAADKALFTTMAVLGAAVSALPVLREGFSVRSLQEYARDRSDAPPPSSGRPVIFGSRLPFGSRLRTVAARGACASASTPRSAPARVGSRCRRRRRPRVRLRTVDAAASTVAVVKPQVSFFERFGSAGYAALEEVMAAARAAGLLVIADAKRGDIGTTMDAYAAAWLVPALRWRPTR
jgi:hypothetical protein